jgi:hypothetical protein
MFPSDRSPASPFPPELEALTQRLEEVEKQIAHLASLMVGQSDSNRTVVARSFVVTDPEGKRRAVLGMSEDGPKLILADGNGKGGASLELNSEGAFLKLGDTRGNQTVEISAEEHGPGIRLFRTDGKPAVAMLVTCIEETIDVTSADVTSVPIYASVSQIFLLDANGEHRLKLALEGEGPHLEMSNKDGNANAKLVVQEGRPRLVFGKDDKVIWSAP